jgi:hypothetical protein
MNNDGLFNANELRVNLKGPNGYWLTTYEVGGILKWRYIDPANPNERAGELKMGLYDFDRKIYTTGMTLHTSDPVLRRIN